MTTTLVEIARWHGRQAKATTGADCDFHTEAAKLLRDLAKRRTEHWRNITAALAERKAQGKTLGRARVPAEIEEAIRTALRTGRKGMQAIAKEIGVAPVPFSRSRQKWAKNSPAFRATIKMRRRVIQIVALYRRQPWAKGSVALLFSDGRKPG
jgi:hypothetical protein